MKDLDKMYGDDLDLQDSEEDEENFHDQDELDDAPDSTVDLANQAYRKMDPYVKKRNTMMRHKEYRTITVGSENLLKNGQMINVSISDPFNEKVFHETDKIILCKKDDQHYALGSFCGYDFTNLG